MNVDGEDMEIEWATRKDAEDLAEVLAPAFEDYVEVVIGDKTGPRV